MKRKLLIVLLFLGTAAESFAQSVPDNTDGRLWRLCKVWGYMKYYSPGTCQIKWDSLLNATIPLVQNATSNTDFNGRIMDMLDYVGQVPPALATPVPAADSNLNLQLGWTDDNVFSADVRSFLDIFESRAGANDSISCRLKFNDYTDPNYTSRINFRNDEVDLSIQYTDVNDRLTVLFHYWNAFNYFGPYRRLADQDWDTTLLHTIPEVIAAASPSDFHFAMIKAQSTMGDSHGVFYSGYYANVLGSFFAGIVVNRVEDKIVVTKVHPTVTGINVGDIVLSIDGILINDVMETYRDIIAASNEPAYFRDVCRRLVCGQNTSKIFELADASGQTYTRTLVYSMPGTTWADWALYDPKPVWSTLCNGYGYVNMGKLTSGEVPQMYEDLKDKEAIVFDVRNYPKGTMWQIAPLIFPEPIVSANFFEPDLSAAGRFKIRDDGDNLGSWHNTDPYSGQLFFLVNEETQSHAEYTVQYLSHFPGSKVVGTQTAGADGNIAYTIYPGLYFYFTSLGWYYDDWYQCQRNGIKVDQTVAPTIQGVREGRDEVLQSVSGCTSSVSAKNGSEIAVTLYPNPVTDRATIHIVAKSNDKATIRITDVMGNTWYLVADKSVGIAATIQELDTSRLSAGIYFVKISTVKGGVKTMKLVKR